jgi:AcrR family transcriptional regulator
MVRIVKSHDDRRNELLDVADRLFSTKGFSSTTINDIINEIGIAKGTFYHYFQSKEQILDAINERYIDLIYERASAISLSEASLPEKLLGVFMSMQIRDQVSDEMLSEIHRPENALMHAKTMHSVIERLSPILADIIRCGVASGEFICTFPLEYMQIFLSSALVLTDENNLDLVPNQGNFLIALISLIELSLGVKAGSFVEMFEKAGSV